MEWGVGVGVWCVVGRRERKKKVRTVMCGWVMGPPRTEPLTTMPESNLVSEGGRGEGCGSREQRKRFTVRATPVPWGPGATSGMVISCCCCCWPVVLPLRACVGCAWVCVSVRPGFSMCRGGEGAACSAGLLLFCQAGQGRGKGYLGTCILLSVFASCGAAVLLRCAVLLCLSRPGPWSHTPAGQWCGVADGGGGGDLLRPAWMGMESGQGDLD